jgi:putative PIN family toxin of toxin-antitoxin system
MPPLDIPRAVLDTNVWLDWLAFDDAGLAALRAAHAAGLMEIVIDAACEAELERVLAYDFGKRRLEDAAQSAALDACRRIARRVDTPPVAPGALPRCSDPDDQKFLELALGAKADFLVTRDRALLDLARRRLPFRVLAPADVKIS